MLSPGAVDTPKFDEQFPSKEGAAEARRHIAAMTPLARLARPEEIASAAYSSPRIRAATSPASIFPSKAA